MQGESGPESDQTPLETAESAVHDPRSTDGDGLTPQEAAALGRARNLSWLLDESIRVPGTNYRIGLDPLLGLVPIGGDALSAVLALYPIVEAARFGAPKRTLVWMLGRVGIDAVVGSVPLIGDVLDSVWKANERNVATLERIIESD